MEKTESSLNLFLSHLVTTTNLKMKKTRPLSLSQDLNLVIFSCRIKLAITNTISSFRMTSIPKVTLNGSSIELPILKRVLKSNLTCSIWSNLNLYIMKVWKYLFTLRKNKRKLLPFHHQLRRKRNAMKAGIGEETIWAISKTIIEKINLSKPGIKDAIIPLRSLTHLSMMMIRYTLPIHNLTLILI